MIDRKEIEAMVVLLDDSDEEVVRHITDRLLSFGKEVVPLLEDLTLSQLNELHKERLDLIIHKIQYSDIAANLESWAKSGALDLFEGSIIAATYQYPGIDVQRLNNQLDKIKLDIWLEMNNHLTPLEKIKKINYIFYRLYGFKGDTENYHSPANSYLNKVLETKKGNPISLAIIYSILCQRLGIPVFGVNLPQHFILAFKDDRIYPNDTSIKGFEFLDHRKAGETLFYINAFNDGTIFSKWNIDQFLKQLKIEPREIYYEPCSNVDIIMRVFRNLIFSYEKIGKKQKVKDLNNFLDLLKPYSTPII